MKSYLHTKEPHYLYSSFLLVINYFGENGLDIGMQGFIQDFLLWGEFFSELQISPPLTPRNNFTVASVWQLACVRA